MVESNQAKFHSSLYNSVGKPKTGHKWAADSSGARAPGGGRTKVKGRGASFPRGLDQLGPPLKEDHLGDVQFPRLDVAPWCKEAKKILAELTVPWEDRVNRPLEEEEDGQIPRPSVWLQWDSRHGASWLRSAAEESLPSQFVERSQPLDGQERRGRWQLAGWGRQQTDPVATADPPPGDSSTLWRRQECENQGLQHPFPSSPRCLITELCGFTFHLCYFIRNRNVIQHAHLTVMWRPLQPNFTSQDNLLHTGWQPQ